MATLLYNNRPSLRPSRALSAMLADMLREPQVPVAQPTPAFMPAADVLETSAGFELYLALPGGKKEAVNIEFLAGQLVVSSSRPNPAEAGNGAAVTATNIPAGNAENTLVKVADEAAPAPKLRRLETNYGSFSRSFRLPDTVDVQLIGAELADGILRVTLPFATEKVTRQHIEIR